MTYQNNGSFRYGIASLSVASTALALSAFGDTVNSTTVALGLLIAVLCVATFIGRNPALLSSLIAMLCFNFFFLPPFRTFTIGDPQNLLAWAAFTVTAVIAGELSEYARRRARESERLYSELESAFESATRAEAFKQGEKLKSALLDAVTHDLRTPLTSIKASVTTLIENEGGQRTIELDGADRRDLLSIIDEESDRLNKFIEGMVQIARLESGGKTSKSLASIDEVFSNVLGRFAADPAKRINVTIEDDLPLVVGDGIALSEALFNVVENAIKYSPIDKPVKLKAERWGNAVRIVVTDRGPGIPADMREKVFDKFTRLDRNTTGLGLGLAIAKGVVDSQGGEISVSPGENGMGTTVNLKLIVEDEAQ